MPHPALKLLVSELTAITAYGFMYEGANNSQLAKLKADVANHVLPVARTRVIFDSNSEVAGYLTGESIPTQYGMLFNIHAAMLHPKHQGKGVIKSATDTELEATRAKAIAFQTGSGRMFGFGQKFGTHSNDLAMEFGPLIGTDNPKLREVGGAEMVLDEGRYPALGLYLDRARFIREGYAIPGLLPEHACLFGALLYSNFEGGSI